YGQQFFPFLRPVALQAGDCVEVNLAADMVRDEYIWRWETTVVGADGSQRAAFRQSSLAGAMVSREQLRKRGQSFVARLNDDARVDRFILEQMAAARSLGEIARGV